MNKRVAVSTLPFQLSSFALLLLTSRQPGTTNGSRTSSSCFATATNRSCACVRVHAYHDSRLSRIWERTHFITGSLMTCSRRHESTSAAINPHPLNPARARGQHRCSTGLVGRTMRHGPCVVTFPVAFTCCGSRKNQPACLCISNKPLDMPEDSPHRPRQRKSRRAV